MSLFKEEPSAGAASPASLRRFVSERGKILPRRVTGTCAKHQRKINLAIKRARAIALLPFSAD
jgi:small subunit ribosomal protein S18